MLILSVADIQKLIKKTSLEGLLRELLVALEVDFRRWHEFKLSARHATHFPHGVIELMPCADRDYYSYKYVNGHPGNSAHGKLNVVAIGQLSDVESGYPLLISEMTLLTALRTAATGILAANYLARKNSTILAIIGCGAQAEFQVSAFSFQYDLQEIRYFDVDGMAMEKFSHNLTRLQIKMVRCASTKDAIHGADIIITATAVKCKQALFKLSEVKSGTHIHAMGGDCPGKTELGTDLMRSCKIVVEYKPQTMVEGDSQQCSKENIYAELWELVGGQSIGRENDDEITIFDSVGFALEDYSTLRIAYVLAIKYQLGTEFSFIPSLQNPKDLYSLISP
jgi:ornithine cyclodeaminase